MDIYVMRATYPVDDETIQEVKDLLEASQELNKDLSLLMKEDLWKNAECKGFMILAYNEQDQLLGVLCASDMFGFNTYEWSIAVHPQFRRIGIGTAIFQAFANALLERGAMGDMAVAYHEEASALFLEKLGYDFSSAEATLQALPQHHPKNWNRTIRPYKEDDKNKVIALMQEGFSDLPEETEELIYYNTNTEGRMLYMVVELDESVATVTLAEERESLWITAFVVGEEHQKRGIGSEVLQWVRHKASEKGMESVLLDVEVENQNALRIYQNNDFTIIQQIDYFVKNNK
ncbi:GNAT family N-acetyltransferase [Rummeliibacillus stabekisii]|uniref:GNAT family N-acetyltransferase n=1 Tax=Rummeliibacillus stabekisii TaxID=241244 RepID=UPI003721AE12